MSWSPDSYLRHQAQTEFGGAVRAATLRRLWATLTGQNSHLIPFEELRTTLGTIGQLYRGSQVVPLDRIIGSLGRSNDFDRVFMPTQRHSRGKWLSVDMAHLMGIALPAVTLYRVGDAYFVVDGHHRVSVARSKGQGFIDAEVFDVQTSVPVTADLRLEDLDTLAAYREFLAQTKLGVLRPGVLIELTMPGDYVRLVDHIRVHKYFLDREASRDTSWEEAVTHWYDAIFLPLLETIRQHHLLADFPGHKEADLYLWIIDHAYYLSQRVGYQPSNWQVAADFVRSFSRRPRHLWARARQRLYRWLMPDQLEAGPPAGSWREERASEQTQQHLFRDILVTVSGAESGWRALAQAAEVARREGSTLHGLHVVASEDEEALARGHDVLEEFRRRCEGFGRPYTTSLARGKVEQQIIERARWVDMVVINQRREHGRWAEKPLGTIFQMVSTQAARPILAVPGAQLTTLRHVLLAYDGSPKAREALFVFRHLLCCWHVEGTILTVDSGRAGSRNLAFAAKYAHDSGCPQVGQRLDSGEAPEAILRAMEAERAEWLLLGGYGFQPLVKAFLGSTVDRVLREAWFPVLICH